MVPGGYFGQALVVDAGTATASALPLSDGLLRAYIGGAGSGPGSCTASARPAPVGAGCLNSLRILSPGGGPGALPARVAEMP